MRKAKLDILEELPELEIGHDTDLKDGDASVQDAPRRVWALNKLLLIGVPILLVLALVIGGFVFALSGKKPEMAVVQDEQVFHEEQGSVTIELDHAQMPDVLPKDTKMIAFNDFIIDIKDETGRIHLLMCDLVVDLTEPRDMARWEGSPEIRQIIYETMNKRNPVALRAVAERKRIRQDLVLRLNGLLGDDSVRNVYFTKYLIL